MEKETAGREEERQQTEEEGAGWRCRESLGRAARQRIKNKRGRELDQERW